MVSGGLTEEDVKNRFITPAMEKSGWKKEWCWMEYYFTNGQVIVRGKYTERGTRKKADYLLTSKDGQIALAIVEAKDMTHVVGSGLQQAMGYANTLQVPFAYASNGEKFIEHDFFTGKERYLELDEFPTPDELWARYLKGKNLTPNQVAIITEQNYYNTFTQKKPRYYQQLAINCTLEAIARGQRRILIVMATGTGKTFTAFQIVWKLIQTKTVNRVLYLADRNILIDQTMQQDFKPFEKVMKKIEHRNMDSSYEVYMSLYQQLAGNDKEEPFRNFKPEFFDLIIVDECHRGSAKEESQWRRILDYFQPAIQIGMTATPKETKKVSNITYFGEPVYTYSLKQGIDDGFLAPYKVIRIGLDRDLEGWRPYKGQRDLNGEIIDDREYGINDYDRVLIIDERTQAVAKCITKWLKANGRFSKTIVFCVDQDHAERMRMALVNENPDLMQENSKYIMRITSDDDDGKKQLDYFIDANEKYPALVTTSKLLTTGVDCKTCKLIVLDSVINSMTEFKQIIGRGTRLYPDQGKEYFTIMDFRDDCRLFSDPDFDGNPVVIIDGGDGGEGWEPGETGTPDPGPEDPDTPGDPSAPFPEGGSDGPGGTFDPPDPEPPQAKKYHVNGVTVRVLNERIQYYDKNGKLVNESMTDYTKRNVKEEYANLDVFLQAWNAADKKEAISKALVDRGVILDALRDEAGNKELDDFDLIMHIAYDQKPLTRRERVNNVKKRDYLHKFSAICQQVLSALMDKYMNEGVSELEDTHVLENEPFDRFGSPAKIAKLFGGKEGYVQAVKEMIQQIYAPM